MKTWFSRDEGTGHDVDLKTIGHRSPSSGGDIGPETVSNIEHMLKEHADRKQSDNSNYL